MMLESGSGNGKLASIDGDNRLNVASFNIPFVHLIAKDYGRVFVANSTATITGAGTTTAMHLTNTSPNKTMVITRATLQVFGLTGGAALPAATEYFTGGFGYEYASGGVPKTLVNSTAGSAVQAGATLYESNPTLTGSGDEFIRVYPVNSAPIEQRTEGGVIILPRQSLTIRWTGTATAGTIACSVGFAMTDVGEYSG